MKNLLKNHLFTVTFLVSASLAQAQTIDAFATGIRLAHNTPATPTAHTLKSTYIVSGDSGLSLSPATNTPVDSSNTVTCPGTGHCLLQADQWVQFIGNGTSDNGTEICLYVDGAVINNVCYFAGELNTGYYGSQLSTSQGVSVTAGTHTVQTQVMSINGGTLGFYNLTYRIYKP